MTGAASIVPGPQGEQGLRGFNGTDGVNGTQGPPGITFINNTNTYTTSNSSSEFRLQFFDIARLSQFVITKIFPSTRVFL